MPILAILRDVGYKAHPQNPTNCEEISYSGACPFCKDGVDRFIIWPHSKSRRCSGRFWCRKCLKSGDSIALLMWVKDISDEREAKRIFYQTYGQPDKQHIFTPKHPQKIKVPAPMWQEKLGCFVENAHDKIWKEQTVLQKLFKRGIPKETIQDFKIGFNSFKTIYKAKDLGYEENRDIIIFPGIVLPTFEPNGKLIRIKVRRMDWKPSDKFGKYLAVSGSLGGLNLIGNRKAPHVVVVESELDAFAVQNALQDKALIVAVGSNTKNPDYATDYLIKKKDRLIVIYDNDDAGKVMLDKWSGLYKKTQGVTSPVGKDVGEAFERGYDVKSWLENLLSDNP